MASLLPASQSSDDHTCINFEEKNFQFLGNDGEIFHTAGYECVQCNQFYTAIGLENLTSSRRQMSQNLMQDDLPGLMGEDQAGMGLCLDSVDISATKHMFQNDPEQNEMDIGIPHQYSLNSEMENQTQDTSYGGIVSESPPIKCKDTTGQTPVSIAASDPAYLIGQPRVDYSQLLVGSSATPTAINSPVSSPIDLEPRPLQGVLTSSSQDSQSFEDLPNSDNVLQTTSPVENPTATSSDSEFRISGENVVVTDIRDYFQDRLDHRQVHDPPIGFSMNSCYGDDLGKNLQANSENLPLKADVAAEGASSESYEQYLQQMDNKQVVLKSVGDNREENFPSHDNLQKNIDDVTHELLQSVSDNTEKRLTHDRLHDKDHSPQDVLQSVSDNTSALPINEDSTQESLSSVSDNAGKSLCHDGLQASMIKTVSSDNLTHSSDMNKEDNSTDSQNNHNQEDKTNEKKLVCHPVSNNMENSETNNDSALNEDDFGAEDSSILNTNTSSVEVKNNVISTENVQDEASVAMGDKKLTKGNMVLERLIAELESPRDSEKKPGTKVLFINSNDSEENTKVKITVSQDQKRDISSPDLSKVTDTKVKPETVLTTEKATSQSQENTPEKAQLKTDEEMPDTSDSGQSVTTNNEEKELSDSKEKGENQLKSTSKESSEEVVDSRDAIKPVVINLSKNKNQYCPPWSIKTGLPAGGRFKTITLYKCKFCNVRFFTLEALESHSYRAHSERMQSGDRKSGDPAAKDDGNKDNEGQNPGAETTNDLTRANSGQLKREAPDQDAQQRQPLKVRVVRIKKPDKNTADKDLPQQTADGENSYICNHCGEKLRSIDDLEQHKKVKHPGLTEKPSENICCQECNMKFDSVQALHAHMVTHTQAYKAKMSSQPLPTLHTKQLVTKADQPQPSKEIDQVTTSSSEKGTSEAVARKLFTGRSGNHGDEHSEELPVVINVSQSTTVSEGLTTMTPPVQVKIEKTHTRSASSLVGSTQEVAIEEQHMNSSNLDLMCDLAGVMGTEVTTDSQPYRLSSLVLSEYSEDSPDKTERQDIERHIVSISCIRCNKTYSCVEKCSYALQCSACRWHFTSPAHLQCHYDHFHLHDRSCPLCPFSLGRGSGTMMDRHFKNTHANTEIYHCYLCEGTFTTRACLGNHLSRHFNGTGQHKCLHCHMRFEKATRLNVHKVRNHTRLLGYPTNAKPPPPHSPDCPATLYMCGVCGRQYEYEGTLRMHLKKHTFSPLSSAATPNVQSINNMKNQQLGDLSMVAEEMEGGTEEGEGQVVEDEDFHNINEDRILLEGQEVVEVTANMLPPAIQHHVI